jgi:hypothetical protein
MTDPRTIAARHACSHLRRVARLDRPDDIHAAMNRAQEPTGHPAVNDMRRNPSGEQPVAPHHAVRSGQGGDPPI